MKECLYGWYPPAKDILKTYQGKNPTDSYTKECFYQHPNSRYANKPGIKTPEDPLDKPTWRASPQQVRKYHSWARSLSRSSQCSDRSKPSTINLQIRGQSAQGHKGVHRTQTPASDTHLASASTVRRTMTPSPPEAAPARPESGISSRVTPDGKLFAPSPDPRLSLQSPTDGYIYKKVTHSPKPPVKAWSTKTQETKHTPIPDFQDFYNAMKDEHNREPHPSSQAINLNRCNHVSSHELEYRKHIAEAVRDDVTPTSDRPDRAKSATSLRPRVCTHRPVKSAGPVRNPPLGATLSSYITNEDTQDPEEAKREHQRKLDEMVDELTDEKSYETSLTPPIIVPLEDEEELGVDQPLDYYEQLERHGWRMQVHGDPLGLKRQCISKRQPFTVKVPVKVIPPNPIPARSECFDTFFLNTIPRRPMSYTIHQDWASEVLHAKRMELQKRDGEPYKYKTANFSFAY